MRQGHFLRLWLMASCCLLLAGCVTKSVGATETSIHYQWWLPFGILVAGVAFVPIGLRLQDVSERWAWALVIAGPIAALGFAPSLFLERTVVSEKGFSVHSGIWGMTANEDVDFASIASIRVAQEDTGGRHSREIEVLYFEKKTGGTVRLPLNNDVKIEAGKEIVVRAALLGLPLGGGR